MLISRSVPQKQKKCLHVFSNISKLQAFTGGIISGRTKVYIPLGYGLPFIPLGVLFIVYPDDLGIDPRCFVGWNTAAKHVYLLTNLGISLVAVIFALIVVVNVAKPQTKRRYIKYKWY